MWRFRDPEIHLSAMGGVSQLLEWELFGLISLTPARAYHIDLGAGGKEDPAVVKLAGPECQVGNFRTL